MGGGQAVGDLGGDGQGFRGGERAALDLGPQAFAVAEGHGHEHLPGAALADLIDRADVRVVEDRGRLGLVDEPLPGLGVVGQLAGKELEGHGAPELEVVRFVDDAHTAPADLPGDPVLAGDDGPGGEAGQARLDGLGEGSNVGRFSQERGRAGAAEPGRIRIDGAALGTIQFCLPSSIALTISLIAGLSQIR
jgi:hypothetical protein